MVAPPAGAQTGWKNLGRLNKCCLALRMTFGLIALLIGVANLIAMSKYRTDYRVCADEVNAATAHASESESSSSGHDEGSTVNEKGDFFLLLTTIWAGVYFLTTFIVICLRISRGVKAVEF